MFFYYIYLFFLAFLLVFSALFAPFTGAFIFNPTDYADRYAYFPNLAVWVFLGYFLERIYRNYDRIVPYLKLAGSALGIYMIGMTLWNMQMWKDSLTLVRWGIYSHEYPNDKFLMIHAKYGFIEQDPEIQFCVNGRDLSQITGKKGQKTTARFPNLLNQVKMQIAVSALRQAQDNYNAKFNQAVADATKDASADIAQYMCQKMAEVGASTLTSPSVDLAPPYAISYEVGTGLNAEDLTTGGHGTIDLGKVSYKNNGYLGKSSGDLNGGTKETTAVFNRETRTCHVCTTIVTQNCKTTGSKSWFHNNRNTSCTTNAPIEKCEDIPM